MPLTPGARLGPYEIVAAVGAGGMGEVYRAIDTRLDRIVAVKVLPRSLSDDPEFRARFAREAKTISSLDHPHICGLYDVGDSEGTAFLVMQYLEGETLGARLSRGALPLDQALRCGCEIAAALDHAHRRNIVHRDLKPGNVMLTKSGARLLDFGLAKPVSEFADARSTRLDTPLTSRGSILGTLPYMAPEQIEGRDADARTDLFAFGAVLHEMLTGVRAFNAASSASLAGAILRDDPPPPSTRAAGVPLALDHVVRRCLAKDPDDRWASAHDLVIELTWIRDGNSDVKAPIAPTAFHRGRRAWLALPFLLAGVAVGGWLLRGSTSVTRQLSRFVVVPPANRSWLVWGEPSVSPDGRHIAMVATEPGGQLTLWVRPIDKLAARKVEGARQLPDARPFWSADSRWVIFAEGQQVKRVDVAGGSPQPLCAIGRTEDFGGATTNRDGVVLLGFTNRPIHRVPLSGGVPQPVSKLDTQRRELGQISPWFLPDGKHYLFVSRSSRLTVVVGTLGSDERTELVPNAETPEYVPPGLILFRREGRPMAQLFDAAQLRIEGEAQPIEPAFHPESSFASITGTLTYRAQLGGPVRRNGEITAGNTRLAWIDRAGREVEALTPFGGYFNPRLSPDERTILVEQFDNENAGDLWTFDIRRKLGTRVTFDARRDSDGVLSPHGDAIAWARGGDAGGEIVVSEPGRSDAPRILVRAGDGELGPFIADWSPDGHYIAISRLTVIGASTIEFVPVDGGDAIRWPSSGASEGNVRFSPDSRWVAYWSNETGTNEVYVRGFPPSGEKIRVSSTGGMQPSWRHDGNEVYYLSPDRTLMAVAVRKVGGRLEFGAPVPLFKAPIADPGWGRNHYEPAAEGRKFLVNVLDPTRSTGSPDVVVVLDWAEAMYAELKSAARTRRD